MRTMKFLTYAVFVLFLGVAISSCKGDDGADGVDGATGPAGVDGNANVTSVTFPNSTVVVGNNNFSVPALTQSIVDTGVVLGYVQPSGVTHWFTLPYVTFTPTFHMEILTISLEQIAVASNFADTVNLRFILIESSTNGKSAGNPQEAIYTELKNAGIDINNYDEVCDYYGINPK